MKFTFCILYWTTSSILNIFGQKSEIIDCTNDELVTSIFNDPIELTMRGVIKMYGHVTINEILSTSNNEFELNYIDARLESSNINGSTNLFIFTTEHFGNYAKEQTATRISLKIHLGCGMGKERVVIFFQPLREGNYFSPMFPKTHYELLIPTPIFAGFDLTAFVQITARDDDLTHNQISFRSNDSLQHSISVGTQNITSADKKTYFVNLTLERILLELPQPIEFEIVATDNGEPQRNSTASVTIRSDPRRSLPPKPHFTEILYKSYINLDFNMRPLQIELANGTYGPEVEFSLNGVGVEGFSLRDNKNGSIAILWNANKVNRSEILKRRTWELHVRAQHKKLLEVGRACVLVEMADIKNNFNFMSSYYEGDIDEMGLLHMNSIIFNPFTYQTDMKFSLQSHDINFFYLTIQNFSVQLHLNNSFTWHATDDIGYLKLTLLASWETLSAMTNVVIKLPQIRNQTREQFLFYFEKPLYVGQWNATHGLDLETIALKTNSPNASTIEYNLGGQDSDKFYVIKNENNIEIKFGLPDKEETKLKSFYLLNLEAKLNGTKTFSSVLITAPERRRNKIFLTHVIKGSLLFNNTSQQLLMESIPVAEDLGDKVKELILRLRGDHSLHFQIKKNLTTKSIAFVQRTPLPSTVFSIKHLLNMTVQAIMPGVNGFNDTLMVFIELPMKECPIPMAAPQNRVQFSSNNYVFTAHPNQTGILGIVNAFTNDASSSLHYILDMENELLAQRLSINPFTGVLTLYDVIEEGNYLFNVTAENIATHDQAVAKALLKVQHEEKCTLLEGVAVDKTLMVLHVDEEKPNYGLMDLKFNENCTFHIVDMWPNDKEYVHVNYIFNMLDAIAIDREDEIFENMTEAQIVVKLKLRCDKEDRQRNLTIDIPKPEGHRASQITISNDLAYAPDIMWIYIKIDDINDNAPEFKISEAPIYLAYPAGKAALDLYPEYLTKIEAFDRDLDYNAAIAFAMKENPYFDIEPKTGQIYPKDKALSKDEQTELIISAIDQYGEGLISNTVVLVKGLSADFYSLVTLKETSPKNKQQIENNLSQEIGYNINILKMSYVPHAENQRSYGNSNFSCKAWIYAYDKHQLVTHKEMQERILTQHPEAFAMDIESYDEASLPSSTQNDSNLCYLITIIVLSLTSFSSLVFIIWRFCYKSALTAKCDTKTASLAATHDENGQQPFCASCSHGIDRSTVCVECKHDNSNHVKFSDLAGNGTLDGSQSK